MWTTIHRLTRLGATMLTTLTMRGVGDRYHRHEIESMQMAVAADVVAVAVVAVWCTAATEDARLIFRAAGGGATMRRAAVMRS